MTERVLEADGREKLPRDRPSLTRRFKIRYVDAIDKTPRKLKFYVVAGLYADNRLAELFIYSDKKDEFDGLVAGMLDALGTSISIGLQYGAPLKLFTDKLRHHNFGPSGFIKDKDFPSCTSMFDLIAQWLQKTFPDGKLRADTREDPTNGR